jgi:hypothetical protein
MFSMFMVVFLFLEFEHLGTPYCSNLTVEGDLDYYEKRYNTGFNKKPEHIVHAGSCTWL